LRCKAVLRTGTRPCDLAGTALWAVLQTRELVARHHPIDRGSAVACLLFKFFTAAVSGLIWQLTLVVPAASAYLVGDATRLGAARIDRDTLHRRIAPRARP